MGDKKKRKQKSGGGAVQKKILLLLLGGVALGLSGSPSRYFYILKKIRKEWADIDRSVLNRAIRSLYRSRLVEQKNNKDGTSTLVLSKNGERVALTYNLESMGVKRPEQWDGQWRIVMFDIPERLKKVRESLRHHLKDMQFRELQKSVFVHPFPCLEEIEYLVEFYNIPKHVRFITAIEIDNELHLKKHFNLL
jgi:DNA-binding transcriptional regulator PaaX